MNEVLNLVVFLLIFLILIGIIIYALALIEYNNYYEKTIRGGSEPSTFGGWLNKYLELFENRERNKCQKLSLEKK